MNRNSFITAFPPLVFFLFLLSCKGPVNKNKGPAPAVKPLEKTQTIELEPLKNIPLEESALFRMESPGEFQVVDTGEQRFSYETVNFKLGEATHITDVFLKNSNLGRHITLILNNDRVIRKASPEFSVHLEAGHYVALSFLTRTNYESVKGPEAYVIRQFNAGKSKSKDIDLTGPNLFYHMPYGNYSGRECDHILLDFFIINCSLSADSYKVRVMINDSVFMVDDWIPQIIKGLPEGENTITIELIGRDGARVSSPFNSATRKISLSQKEPA